MISEGFSSIQGNARPVLLARIAVTSPGECHNPGRLVKAAQEFVAGSGTSPCSWRGAQAGDLVSAAGRASFLTLILVCVPWLSKIDSISLVLPER